MNADHTLLLELFDQALHAKNKTIMEKYDMVQAFRDALAKVTTPPRAPAAPNSVWVIMDKYGSRSYGWSANDALKSVDINSAIVAVALYAEGSATIAFTNAGNWVALRERAISETKTK
jgi:hypothetical protein